MHLIFNRIPFFAGEEIVLMSSKIMIQIKILNMIDKMELELLKILPALGSRGCRALTIVIEVQLQSKIGHFNGRDKDIVLAAKFAVITSKP